jgi:integrase
LGVLTVSRAVVELRAKIQEPGTRFLVKQYPKDGEWRRLRLAPRMVAKIRAHVAARGLGADCLLFVMPEPDGPACRSRPEVLRDPETLGLTPPNSRGLRYRHGTTTAYSKEGCRCQYCRDAVAAYRAARRATGNDQPRSPRRVTTDGHISNEWFRNNIWRGALEAADLGFRVTPHGLRHAHASWLLAGERTSR